MSSLAVESWSWYGLSWVIVIARLISRSLLQKSVKKLQIDDWLMLSAMVTDTVLMVGMNMISTTSSNLIDPNDTRPLTPENIQERIFGSKLVVVVEQMQILTVWLVKACLLIMYSRLTMSLKQNVAVKIVAVYVAVGFVLMEVLYLGVWCRPFTDYFKVPTTNVQCTAATNHLITNAVLNISSDLMIILIPMPLLIHSQLPLKRKVLLCGIFGLGTFTILCAVLNKFYSFSAPFGQDWTFWYIRESSIAIITANLPFTWTLLRKVFNVSAFNGKTTSNQQTSHATSSRYPQNRSSRNNYNNRHTYGGSNSHSRNSIRMDEDLEFGRADSQEHINKVRYEPALKIYQTYDVEVSSESSMGRNNRKVPLPPLSQSDGSFMANQYPSRSPSKAHLRDEREEESVTSMEAEAGGVVTRIRAV